MPKPTSNHTDKAGELTSIVPSPTALKALAHSERLNMLGLLRLNGPATATMLAKRLNLNSGSTSYHLRQLARHGFISSAPELGDKRDRWWRATHDLTHWELADLEGEALQAGLAMSQAVIACHAAQMQQALQQHHDLPREWQHASTSSDYVFALPPDKAQKLVKKIEEILIRAAADAKPSATALQKSERHFTILLHAFPVPPPHEDKPA